MPTLSPTDGGTSALLAYVGGYTTPDRNGRAPGITAWRVDAADSPWTMLGTTPCENPSLLRVSPDERTIYAVHGGRHDVSALTRNPAEPELGLLGRAECGGLNPVDVGRWPDGSAVVVANYSGGTVAVLPLAPDGAPAPPRQVIALARDGVSGPSLPHGVTFDPSGRFVLIPDKGLDCVFVFTLSGTQLEPVGFGPASPGSGPRHVVFHPTLPIVYAVCELACSVQPFRWDPSTGALVPLPPVSTLPEPVKDGYWSAEIAIAPDGRTLYASTRGHDSLAWFALDPSTGAPEFRGSTSCLGKEPRLFVLSPDGHTLLCANQESDTIVAFAIHADGSLGGGHVVAEVGSPTAICFVRAP